MAASTAAGAGLHGGGWVRPFVSTWGRLTDIRVTAPIAALAVLVLLVVLPLVTMLVASLRPAGHAAV